MKYRADLDGIRAIAVLSVVIFHLGVTGFEGGYVGVDVFFVISGYLITSIIKSKYDKGAFRLSEFYFRRIRRLLPPLIATIAVTLLGGSLLMTPYDMVELSGSAVAALFSLSNIVFYQQSGYWDTASELKPLLHTWSLGVEEQFYLFWPGLVLGLLAIRRNVSLGVSLALIAILGATLCIWYTRVDQSAAFYLLPFRVFQFAIGALLIPIIEKLKFVKIEFPLRLRTVIFWSGLFCIGASVTLLGEHTLFPGWAVLLPTCGAALLILAGALPGDCPTLQRLLMENPVSVWVGRVSYSMYLVHWPLVSLYRYQRGADLTVSSQLALALATLLATVALHYGVERVFYNRDHSRERSSQLSNSRFAVRTLAVACLLGLLSATAWMGDGWSWRFPSLQFMPSKEDWNAMRRDKYDKACNILIWPQGRQCDLSAKLQVLVFGNSHEPDGYNFLSGAFPNDRRINLVTFGTNSGCGKLAWKDNRVISSKVNCQKRFDKLLDPEWISQIDVVVYSSNKPYTHDGGGTLALKVFPRLKELNPELRIVTLGSYINTDRDCAFYIYKTGTTDACAWPEHVVYFPVHPESMPLYKSFRTIESYYIDRVALLCKTQEVQTCFTRTKDGVPAFLDKHHQSLEFAQMSGELY